MADVEEVRMSVRSCSNLTADILSPVIAWLNLQEHLHIIVKWIKKWKINFNESKSSHTKLTLRKGHCPAVNINQIIIPQTDVVKYLGLHFDCKLNWKEQIAKKRKQIDIKTKEINWLIRKKSHLSIENKFLIYKAVIKPIWSYGIELWGCASKSNIVIMHRSQSKILRTISHNKCTPVCNKSYAPHRLQHPLRKWRHPWKNR